MSKLIFPIIFLLASSCSNLTLKQEEIRKDHKKEKYYEMGPCVQDSLFNGIVHMYDLKGNEFGYSTYYFGRRNGPYVTKYPNGVTQDSLWMRFDQKEGVGYSFDSLGRLKSKYTYVSDRAVGDQYEYDSSGNPKFYYFAGFEGKSIYSLDFKRDSISGSGKLINYYLDTLTYENGQDSINLFAYLIRPPQDSLQYALAVLKGTKVISTVQIDSHSIFYEKKIEVLQKQFYHALVVYRYNKYKKRNDLEYYVLH